MEAVSAAIPGAPLRSILPLNSPTFVNAIAAVSLDRADSMKVDQERIEKSLANTGRS
jgi:hypothetical protein